MATSAIQQSMDSIAILMAGGIQNVPADVSTGAFDARTVANMLGNYGMPMIFTDCANLDFPCGFAINSKLYV
jgi:hypothetical protein